jgi:cell division septum initiation protein DivIVA
MDELEGVIKNGKAVPFSNGKIFVESDRVLEILDRLRATLPEELEGAKQIIANRENIVQSAYSEANDYVAASKDRAIKLVDENEITINAIQKGEAILENASKAAVDIRRDADAYADEVLTHIELVLKRGLEAVLQGKEQLRAPYDEDDY